MNAVEVGHRWEPITDLTDADLAAASEELPPLARMWQNIRGELDPMQVDDFNERLKREWAIETGIIERLYTLDQGTTRLLIEQGIDASLIASGATDQPPELVAGMIQDHAEAADWLSAISPTPARTNEWVRLGIVTENGRAELLTSFHAIGTEYRGLVAVSMCFYRHQQDDDGENQIIELQPVSVGVFQINYEEPAESVKERFRSWLEDSLVMGLDQWNRSE